MEPKSYLRAKHVISEDLRTVAACEALLKGDMKELGRLMAEAHPKLHSQDFEGSCVEADAMVELGAGFAGADWCTADRWRVRRLHCQFGRAERGGEVCRGAARSLCGKDWNHAGDSYLPRFGWGTPAGIEHLDSAAKSDLI